MNTKKPSKPDVRGRRQTLSRERIAAEALRMIDSEGLEGLNMRKLGAELGCEAMSIYHHLPGKAHLLDAVAELLLLGVHVAAKAEGNWVERLRSTSHSYRSVAVAHPRAFVLLAMRRFNTPGMLRALNDILGIFRDAGFDGEMATRLFRILGSYLNGAAMAAITVRAQIPDAPDSLMIENRPDPEQFPNVSAAAPYLGEAHLEAIFEQGLEMMLAQFGAERRKLLRAARPTAKRGTRRRG
ncbi:MAG: TetR/AcrR family transcriptional regulator C-terminal domain-containing protein [Bacteroidetes bacterium]|nr:TetR/AcrR family transcriptional regulator C-terminal domain-containing protein [Bacteroidota bacterium]